MRQFPGGLSQDPFGQPGQPLGTTVTASGLIYIYSFGPDMDPQSRSAWTATTHVLEPMYDPTNGLRSEGDLFIRIPRP